jgi:hypothetical protein
MSVPGLALPDIPRKNFPGQRLDLNNVTKEIMYYLLLCIRYA